MRIQDRMIKKKTAHIKPAASMRVSGFRKLFDANNMKTKS
jgi:hypothetical protein